MALHLISWETQCIDQVWWLITHAVPCSEQCAQAESNPRKRILHHHLSRIPKAKKYGKWKYLSFTAKSVENYLVNWPRSTSFKAITLASHKICSSNWWHLSNPGDFQSLCVLKYLVRTHKNITWLSSKFQTSLEMKHCDCKSALGSAFTHSAICISLLRLVFVIFVLLLVLFPCFYEFFILSYISIFHLHEIHLFL